MFIVSICQSQLFCFRMIDFFKKFQIGRFLSYVTKEKAFSLTLASVYLGLPLLFSATNSSMKVKP